MRSSKGRRIILGLAALVYAGIAMASLLSPHFMAEGLGQRLDSVDALNEFRAMYVGLWLAIALLLGLAAKHVEDDPRLGDLGALLLLGPVLGRAGSIFLDGMPSGHLWPIFFLELLAGLAILVIRPAGPESESEDEARPESEAEKRPEE